MNPAIFREYDIRGIAEKDFNADFVETLGQAYGTYVRARMLRHCGRDYVLLGSMSSISGRVRHRLCILPCTTMI